MNGPDGKALREAMFLKRFFPVQVPEIPAFLVAMLEGYSLERALQLSTATGASCVASYDALSGLKSFPELEKKIDAGWQKNKGM